MLVLRLAMRFLFRFSVASLSEERQLERSTHLE